MESCAWEALTRRLARLEGVSPSYERVIYWRGSVSDVATDLAGMLSLDQLLELADELRIVWRRMVNSKP